MNSKLYNQASNNETFLDFWRCLCICHDVIQVHFEDSDQQYSGTSIDEIAFLEACKRLDYCSFVERDSGFVTINLKGKTEKYEILKTIEFDSVRKRMSVIAR